MFSPLRVSIAAGWLALVGAAAPPPALVHITQCAPLLGSTMDPNIVTAALNVRFVNATHKPMLGVDFGVLAGTHLEARVHASGHFAPGTEIHKSLPLNPKIFPFPSKHPTCTTLHVAFVDKTTWTNPRYH